MLKRSQRVKNNTMSRHISSSKEQLEQNEMGETQDLECKQKVRK